jgi:RNase P subunit RPR2
MSAQAAASPQVLSNSRCQRCQGPNWVQRIAASRSGFEHWTVRCTKCGHIDQMQVVSNGSQSGPLDNNPHWLQ